MRLYHGLISGGLLACVRFFRDFFLRLWLQIQSQIKTSRAAVAIQPHIGYSHPAISSCGSVGMGEALLLTKQLRKCEMADDRLL